MKKNTSENNFKILESLNMHRFTEEESRCISRGIWYTIHMYSAQALTHEKKQSFIDFIYTIKDSLPCKVCEKHMNDYIDKNPVTDEFNYFVWSWKFHNAVNWRLGKPILDFENARKIYLDGNACTNCGK